LKRRRLVLPGRVSLRQDGAQAPRRVLNFYLKVNIMATGTVKWFNPAKGFGFIQPEDGGKDVFVHISALERAGISSVAEGQKVEYELAAGRDGRASAENLKLTD
jgi:CspA family cold shock protein